MYKFARICNSYNVGTIKNSNGDSNKYFYLGGITGCSQLWETDDYKIINCYNAGELIKTNNSEGQNVYVGNISGYHQKGIIKNCYYIDNNFEGIGKCEDEEKVENLVGVISSEMQKETIITKLNMDEEVYYYDRTSINNGYPILDFQYNKLLNTYSETYEINKTYIKNIKIDEQIGNLKENITTNGEIKVYKGEAEITDNNSILVTGMTVKITLEKQKEEYIIIVTGDVNGDGKANLNDILSINKHRLNKMRLSGANLLAGDVDGNEKADLNDILKINRYRLGKISSL